MHYRFLTVEFPGVTLQKKLAEYITLWPFGPNGVCLSYRGFMKIIPEVAPLVPPIYTSESGKLSIGKPVKSVGREIKVFRAKQTRSEQKWHSPLVRSIF